MDVALPPGTGDDEYMQVSGAVSLLPPGFLPASAARVLPGLSALWGGDAGHVRVRVCVCVSCSLLHVWRG